MQNKSICDDVPGRQKFTNKIKGTTNCFHIYGTFYTRYILYLNIYINIWSEWLTHGDEAETPKCTHIYIYLNRHECCCVGTATHFAAP